MLIKSLLCRNLSGRCDADQVVREPDRSAGINGDAFNRPADVAWDNAGNIYVADGFGTNSRIAKFTKDGDFVKTWGHTGSGPGEFSKIRGLVADAAGNFYVADSGNRRIQVLDSSMTFKSEIKTPEVLRRQHSGERFGQ